MGLLALELSLGVLQPHSFLHANELPLGARLLVLGYTATVLMLFVWAIAKLATFIDRFQGTNFSVKYCLRWIVNTVLTLSLFLYVLSWATFWQVGKFLDSEALRFWIIQPLQVFHWVDLDVGAAVIAATLAFGFALFRWIPRWLTQWNAPAQSKLAQCTKVVFGICLFAAVLGEIYAGRTEQTYLRSTSLYLRARDEMSTPLAHFIANSRASMMGQPEEARVVQPSRLIQREITPMQEYLATVDRAHFKPWNVIVIVVESLRADQLRAYGGHRMSCLP